MSNWPVIIYIFSLFFCTISFFFYISLLFDFIASFNKKNALSIKTLKKKESLGEKMANETFIIVKICFLNVSWLQVLFGKCVCNFLREWLKLNYKSFIIFSVDISHQFSLFYSVFFVLGIIFSWNFKAIFEDEEIEWKIIIYFFLGRKIIDFKLMAK